MSDFFCIEIKPREPDRLGLNAAIRFAIVRSTCDGTLGSRLKHVIVVWRFCSDCRRVTVPYELSFYYCYYHFIRENRWWIKNWQQKKYKSFGSALYSGRSSSIKLS